MSNAARPTSYPYPAVVRIPEEYTPEDCDRPAVANLDGEKVSVHGRDRVDDLVMIGGDAVEALTEPAWRDKIWIDQSLIKPWAMPDGGLACEAVITRDQAGIATEIVVRADEVRAHFEMTGTTAVLQSYRGCQARRQLVLRYTEQLPGVQAVTDETTAASSANQSTASLSQR